MRAVMSMGPPPRHPTYIRLLQGAGARRILVYILAGVLVLVSGLTAVRLARPADPYDSVRVERLPGISGDETAETTNVRWDAETGRTSIDVRESDGVVRRYYLENEGEGLHIWGGEEAPPE